ncbi:reductase, partial [Streptomyces sp. NPDC002787]
MRLLMLGGTEFVGRAVVESALARGWEVTVFHRGRHEPPAGVRSLLGDPTPPGRGAGRGDPHPTRPASRGGGGGVVV